MFPLEILPVLFRSQVYVGVAIPEPDWRVYLVSFRHSAIPYTDPLPVADPEM